MDSTEAFLHKYPSVLVAMARGNSSKMLKTPAAESIST